MSVSTASGRQSQVAEAMFDERNTMLAADPPCSIDTTGSPLDSDCQGCGHTVLLHPGLGGAVQYCLACEYRVLYSWDSLRWPSDDRVGMLDTLEALVEQHCAVPDEERVFDSRGFAPHATAMRILAKNGRFRILDQRGRRVIGRLEH